MHLDNIYNIDLNLLKILDELLRQQNVTKTANAIRLSQPAISCALGRLRNLFDDPLFVGQLASLYLLRSRYSYRVRSRKFSQTPNY
jgi:hypothetical protein|tara:strand:+ start:5136 stop:5393 length:258 start_codon:yes stop_codon:yes gene_type:complete